ncbi:hypothetical protein AJ87_36080 [Rhizobium yanglingense]|nr:hypothetical protein AJ87_36080 [Rhizobium yanglingense]
MRYIFKSALIGLAALGCVTISHSFAGAQELELRVGPGGVGIYDRDRDRDRYYDRRYRPARRACDPDDALDSARDAGLRRARIVRVSPRSVVVQGFTRRGPARMVFANVRGCPEI